ncbi:uncharacterized protein LOC131948905 [Physella acuta]|uniref:uncharacterized protein LOC131948905 n=1 Tax=Physella acuta TaxID=109671 RepID=UPI0027DCD4B7|nr:uncharacterized protein LOC131948905 [Physella acuta]
METRYFTFLGLLFALSTTYSSTNFDESSLTVNLNVENTPVQNGGNFSLKLPAGSDVTSVNIRCRAQSNQLSVNGPRAKSVSGRSALFPVKLYGTGTAMCTCAASHAGGSYRKTSTVTIRHTALPYAPTTSPFLEVNNSTLPDGSTLTVVLNSTATKVSVRCGVSGGYPRVHQTTLKCGNKTVGVPKPVVTFTITYTKQMDGQLCVCSADHVTGRYNKTARFTFDIQYPARVKHLTANNKTGVLKVRPDTPVVIECQADGNPVPELTLRGLKTGTAAFGKTTNSKSNTLSRSFIATTSLDDVYVCTAKNSLNAHVISDRLVQVSVGEHAPSLIARFTVNGETKVEVEAGARLDFRCETAGYLVQWTIKSVTSG